MSREQAVEQLWESRSRSRLLRFSLILAFVSAVWVWFFSDISFADLFTEQRLKNWHRFWTIDAKPDAPQGFAVWLNDQMNSYGYRAMSATLAISVVAIFLAGLIGIFLSIGTARNIGSVKTSSVSWLWRAFCIVLRAIPEFVLAFLLLAVFGVNAWPAILALAIHNAGILGRLGGEVIENLPRRPVDSLYALGASPSQINSQAVFPMGFARYLLYFIYRFETCVREATILGMLGVVSIGYYVIEARAHSDYDQMLLLMVLGALLVFVADLASDLLRRYLEKR